MKHNSVARKTAPVPQCPVCGHGGNIWTEKAKDYVTHIPASWIFRQCSHCKSLWQDPCTVGEDIGKMYPDNYGFTRSVISDLKWKGFKHSIKAGILAGGFGYSDSSLTASSSMGFCAGKFIGKFSISKLQVGRMIRFLDSQPGGRLLDVGCGNGSFLKLMNRLGSESEGIEPDPKAAQVAKASGLKVMEGFLESADLPPAYYDAITLSHVMEHFQQPQVALQKISKCLKPGGVFVSISPNPVGLMSKIYHDKWYQLDAPRHLVIPSPKGYELLCGKFGLKANCWTSHQTTFWILRECSSIRKTGQTGQCHARVMPKLYTAVSSILLSVLPLTGEEVICYGVKQT
jgi:2-polyprenyl-3-methyl-5-hydroxy-6-metoxy-1,4-benzoquinol methylase